VILTTSKTKPALLEVRLISVDKYRRWCTYEHEPPSPFFVSRLSVRCGCCARVRTLALIVQSLN
jgi:hypothetical protein